MAERQRGRERERERKQNAVLAEEPFPVYRAEKRVSWEILESYWMKGRERRRDGETGETAESDGNLAGGSTHARVVSVCTYIPPDIREKVVHITISLLSLSEPRDPVRIPQHTSIEDK